MREQESLDAAYRLAFGRAWSAVQSASSDLGGYGELPARITQALSLILRHEIAVTARANGIVKCHKNGMQSAIDAAGRVVIPKELRDRLGLYRGRPVTIRERDGHIEIEPAETAMSLVLGKSGSVARPKEDLPPLTDEIVRETLERTRR